MKAIEIHAREWFDKANGNSYFSARIYADKEQIGILPFQYGYGDHFIDAANHWLNDNGFIDNPRNKNGIREPLWRYCEENGIYFVAFKQDRCLKRELDK